MEKSALLYTPPAIILYDFTILVAFLFITFNSVAWVWEPQIFAHYSLSIIVTVP